MAFSEKTKLEAKRKSHFACVICHQPFVEVHHILPQADEGSDELDNAAPLCGSCHDLFGANPVKRKQIREMRDFWWEICEKRPANPNLISLNEKLDAIQTQLSKRVVTRLRGEFDPTVQYDVGDIVFISCSLNAGTFACVQKPPIGTSPDIGGGYFMSFPMSPNLGAWMV
jgi:uncharacterized CHY-type Zn-finger protein